MISNAMNSQFIIALLAGLAFVRAASAESPSLNPGAPLSNWVVTNSVPATNEIN